MNILYFFLFLAPLIQCISLNGMQKFKGRSVTTSALTRLAYPKPVFIRHFNEHETVSLDSKVYASLLEKYNQKNDELHHAQNDVYEIHSEIKDIFNSKSESSPGLGHVFITSSRNNSWGFGLGLIAMSNSISLTNSVPLEACLIGALASTSWILLFPYVVYPLAFLRLKQKYKKALCRYKELLPEYTDLARKLNKPIEFSLDTIDFDTYVLRKKSYITIHCMDCSKTGDELSGCQCSPKKLIEKEYSSYQLIKKERYLK